MKLPVKFLALAAAAVALAPNAHAAPARAAKTAKAVREGGAQSALRRFMIALTIGDQAALRATALPLSEGDFAILLSGQKPPATERKKLVGMMAKIPLRTLKPGDTVSRPGKPPLVFTRAYFGPDRTVLQPKGFPLPFVVRRVKGQWRVDAAPVVAARKRADAMRRGGTSGGR